ncbi:MAG: RNA methyltransferase [Bacteroidota bacterium]
MSATFHLLPFVFGVTRQRVNDLAQLSRRRARRDQGVFLVEGIRSVESALAAGAPLTEVLVGHEGGDRAEAIAEAARLAGVTVTRASAKDLGRIADARTSQGVMAVSRRIVAETGDGLAGAARVLALDGVQDPGNVGALVRTAAWFGLDAVLADEATADFESPKAVRAAMGGLWDLRLARVPDLRTALETLGAEAWGADMTGTPLAEWQPSAPSVLVMGSEAHGLSEPLRRYLSGTVSIPGGERPGAESLNVAVAAGVLMHAWSTAR